MFCFISLLPNYFCWVKSLQPYCEQPNGQAPTLFRNNITILQCKELESVPVAEGYSFQVGRLSGQRQFWSRKWPCKFQRAMQRILALSMAGPQNLLMVFPPILMHSATATWFQNPSSFSVPELLLTQSTHLWQHSIAVGTTSIPWTVRALFEAKKN